MANLDDFLKIRNASSITTGTIDNARLPLDVKTAKIQVTNLIALYSLYNNQVQNGDIVAVNDIQSIFIVTDDTQLNNSSGYTLLVKPAAENISEIENLVKTDDYIVQVKGDTFVLRSPAQFKTDLVLVKGDVGLGNVANVDTTTTTNITDSTDKRFVTDALISNTTGTNTGDETQATIKTKLGAATTIDDGYLTTTDWNTFNGKQDNITATTSTDYYRGDKTFATLNKTAVGLDNVDNTSDINKPISTATQNALDVITEINSLTSEPTGFVDRTDSDISFDNLTRTFHLTTTTGYEYYIHGTKYTISTDKSITIPNTDGSYFFFLDTTETLNYVTTFDTTLLRDYVFIASVNWSTTQSKILGLAEERHGITMDYATHSYLHTYVGARIKSTDFGIGNFVLNSNGSSNADYRASIGNGTLTDEDINSVITHSATPTNGFEQLLSPIAELPIMYKIGSGTWYMDDATQDLVKAGTSRIQYNSFSGTWSSVDATNSHYVAMWVFATNFRDSPIRMILGQREDDNLNNANANNTYEALDLTGLSIQEYKILYRLVFQTSDSYTNTNKARLVHVLDLRKSIDQGQLITTSTNHSLSSGLANDDHPQYLNITRGDGRYYTESELDAGQLNNQYYTESEIDTLLSGKSNTGHTHVAANITDLSKTSVGLGNVQNVDQTNANSITSGTLANARLTSNLTEIGNTTFADDDFVVHSSGIMTNKNVSQVKSLLSINNVDNTSDSNKPISTATQNALDDKVDKITGKSLSTNDFTNSYKDEVDFASLAITELGSSVNVSGGILTLTGGVTFSVAPGVGYTRDNTGKMVRVDWSTLTSACVYDGDNFINVDYQGNVVVSTTAAQGDLIALGYIRTTFSNTTVIGFSNTRLRGSDFTFHMGEMFRTTIGSLVQSGCNTGMQATPNDLKITISSGFIWSLFNRFSFPDTSTFTKLFNTSDYGFVPDTVTTANTVNTTLWNDTSQVAASALVTMTAGYYKKDLIAITPEGSVFYVYSNAEWATIDEAKNAPTPAIPEAIKLSVVRSAAIITHYGATFIDELIDIRPMISRLFDTGQAATNATVISHSNLIDLGNDDHIQYLTSTRGDVRYYRKTELDSGSLDTRYYTESEINTLLSGKTNTGHTHLAANITDLSKTSVDLGNVQNVDTTNASNISSGTLSSSRLSANLSEIATISKTNGDIIAVIGGVYAAQTVSATRTSLSIDQVQNVDTTNASNISSGTLANARLSINLSQIGGITFATNDIVTFNGTTLTNVSPSGYKTILALVKGDVGLGNVQNVDTTNASNISSGTLANARLTSNLTQIGDLVLSSGDYLQFNGSALTNVTPSGVKSSLTLVKADVGLGNVVNLDTTTTTNITSALNKRFVTDAQLVVISNTSGTNTGDETQATIKTKLGAATTLVDGYLTTTDWNTFNSKQANITATTSADYYRGDKTFAALNKTAVGLGNVANIDTSNASNISTGTLANARLTANLSDIGGITKTNDDIIQVKLGVYTNRTPAQFKTDLVLVKADVGLGNVVNLDTSTATNITSALNKRFVTDAQLVVIGNTSGTNTGDETQATIKTKLGAATTLVDGYLTSTDWNTFNSKQPTAVNLTQISGITKTNDDIIQVKAGAYTNRTPAQFKTDLVLVKADVGLGNVVNLDTSTATNITSVLNKRFVTDAQLVVIGNTSGTNTGDETQATIKTKLGAATTLVDGYLTTTDWNTFNGKQANITATTSADYYRGDKTFAALNKAAVGLGNVDNTSDVNKPISSLTQTALNAKEPSVTATTSGDYYRGDKTFAVLDKTAVGLSNVANVDTTNASNISSGTLANARLSTNLTQIGDDTFGNGEIIQSFGGTLQNAVLDVGTTGAVEITNTAGSILFDAPYAKGPLNQKSGFFEDFITYSATTISQILARTTTGGGASTSIGTAGNSNDTRNGFIVFTTGTTSAGLAAVASGGLSNINFANIPVGGYEEFGARFQIPLVSNATQSFQIVAGFGDSASGLVPTDGAYISIGGGTVGFQGNTSSNSTRTNSGSLLTTVANTDYVIRIRVSNIAGTLSASYFVNGTQLGSAITTNIPSGAGRAMGIQFGIAKILGNTARTIELDWIYHESFKPRTINY